MKTKRGIWRDRRLLPVAWAVVIVVVSSTPGQELPELGFKSADKLGHLLQSCVLGVLILYAFRRERTLLWGFFFSMVDELHQFFIPGRDCSGYDLLANFAGLALSPVVYRLLSYVKRRVSKINSSP